MTALRLRTVKEDEKIEFHGIDIQREYVNGSLSKVHVEFADGSYFDVRKNGFSSMEFTVAKPPIEKKQWKVFGKYHEVEDFEKVFDDQYKAKDFKNMASNSDLEIEELITYED